jgi:hypothetical protein
MTNHTWPVRACCLTISLFVFLCTFFCLKKGVSLGIEGQKIVAMVGTTSITVKQISYKIGIEQAYGNEEITPEAALISLINDGIELETAAMYKVVVSEDEINSFKRYVDENTKAPEILQKVKLVFSDDQPSYEQIYLAPKIINQKLRDFYSKNEEIHEKEKTLIEKAHSLVFSGKTFQEAAEACGLKSIMFDLKEKENSVPSGLQKYADEDDRPLKNPLVSILETLSAGEVYKNIIEDDYSYRVIRLLGKTDHKYSVEAITVNKKFFDEWFQEQAAKIKIEVTDTELKTSLKTKYPDIWWVKQRL